MTNFAKRNAIFWSGIFLHVINVMDMIAILETNCACVFISLANQLFEAAIESYRIWLKGFTSLPSRRIFAECPIFITAARTKFNAPSVMPWQKLLPAIKANALLASKPFFSQALDRAIFPVPDQSARNKFFPAILALGDFFGPCREEIF
ncbi:MAG: hypothetical protein AAGU32_16415 [Bacillota bacterium]